LGKDLPPQTDCVTCLPRHCDTAWPSRSPSPGRRAHRAGAIHESSVRGFHCRHAQGGRRGWSELWVVGEMGASDLMRLGLVGVPGKSGCRRHAHGGQRGCDHQAACTLPACRAASLREGELHFVDSGIFAYGLHSEPHLGEEPQHREVLHQDLSSEPQETIAPGQMCEVG